jgi:hypothetical protein
MVLQDQLSVRGHYIAAATQFPKENKTPMAPPILGPIARDTYMHVQCYSVAPVCT